jgi:hypothetical protein
LPGALRRYDSVRLSKIRPRDSDIWRVFAPCRHARPSDEDNTRGPSRKPAFAQHVGDVGRGFCGLLSVWAALGSLYRNLWRESVRSAERVPPIVLRLNHGVQCQHELQLPLQQHCSESLHDKLCMRLRPRTADGIGPSGIIPLTNPVTLLCIYVYVRYSQSICTI